jgi:hypothetical protein
MAIGNVISPDEFPEDLAYSMILQISEPFIEGQRHTLKAYRPLMRPV